MSEEKKKAQDKTPDIKSKSPFCCRKDAPAKTDFDKYYYEVSEKEVFKSTGQKDSEGVDLGIVEKVYIVKKIDISDFVNAQADSVGVSAYIRSLTNQGERIEDYHTEVDSSKVQDFSEMPDSLAEVLTSGDRAKEAFKNLDPALRGSHTTIDGFLNSLTKDTVETYIKGKIDSLVPKVEKKVGE